VIFVTVGTHPQPFDRLLEGLRPLAALDELVVQHGSAPAPVEAAEAASYLSASQVAGYIEHARAVVMHAGVGSFVVASHLGDVPFVVPRLRRYGEHVDDHQAQLASALEREGKAVAVWDVGELPSALTAVAGITAPKPSDPTAFHAAVRRALDGLPVDVPATMTLGAVRRAQDEEPRRRAFPALLRRRAVPPES
jgi:UDP-N-acetylglucosamine transferase subunit ALG13